MSSSPTTPEEVLRFRAHFPSIRKGAVHLCNNSMSAVSDAFIAAHTAYVEERLEHGATWHLAMPRHEELKAEFAAMIGARPHEIAVCYTATQALGVLASCFDWKERPGIVFDDYSFPSTTYLWRAQEARGAMVRRVRARPGGGIDPADFDAVLDESVQLVAVAHVSYKSGHRLNLAEVGCRAHAHGALFVVDDYQCCGSREIDVQALGIDVLVAGTVKFMLGSPGVTLMYVREGLLEHLHPTITGWFAQRDPNEFQIETHDEDADASRFQIGTPAFPAIYDSLAGIRLLRSAGIGKVQAWIETLTAYLFEQLAAKGLVATTPRDPARRGPQVSIRSLDAEGVVAALADQGIFASSRDGNIRTAWHYYNTPGDVERLIAALDDMRERMVTQA